MSSTRNRRAADLWWLFFGVIFLAAGCTTTEVPIQTEEPSVVQEAEVPPAPELPETGIVRVVDGDRAYYQIIFPLAHLILQTPFEIQGYAAVSPNLLIFYVNGQNYGVSVNALSDFLPAEGQYTGRQILAHHYQWERSFQESQGSVYLADFRLFQTAGGKIVSSAAFDLPVDRETLAEDEAFRNLGFSFVADSQVLVSVFSSVNATVDETALLSQLVDFVDAIEVDLAGR